MLALPLAVGLLAAAAPDGFSKQVSLHRVGPTSVTFDVEFPAATEVTVTLTGPGAPAALHGAAATHHRVAAEGLKPASAYHYELKAGAARASGTFWTAPPPGDPTPFSFAVLGDSRDHPVWAGIAAQVLKKAPRFALLTGDAVNREDPDDWREFYAAGHALFADVPLFSARGNHDAPGLFALYNPSPEGPGPSTYAFTWGNATFLALDSNTPEEPTQRAFAEKSLAGDAQGPRFVFQHHPLYSCGRHGPSAPMQQAFGALFEHAGVAVDFAGHDHDLIEWQPVGGVHYLVSGGAGSTLYALKGCEGQPFAASSFGFAIVEVAGAKVSWTFYDGVGAALHHGAR
jgi:hypothetical protein